MSAERFDGNRAGHGFSLLELLVVISLIAILAALAAWGVGGILKSVKNRETSLWLATLEVGLTNYQQDNGIFPLNPPNGVPADRLDSLARDGAVILYAALSGDTDQDGAGLVDDPDEVYVDGLAYQFQENAKTRRSEASSGNFAVVDPRGVPLRYLASPPNLAPEEKVSRNPGFDLWSLGGGTPEDPADWITNWGTH